METPNQQSEALLPKLREELTIESGGVALNGSRTWLIHDPFRNRFFRIGQQAFDLLSAWKSVTATQLLEDLKRVGSREYQRDEVEAFGRFLFANSLTSETSDGSYASFVEQDRKSKRAWYKQLIHNYLFFRVPLFRPQKFLDAVWPVLRPIFSDKSVAIFTLLGVLSLYLVLRQWELFSSTLTASFTLESMAIYAAGLVMVKFLHEFGHALMAKKYGVDVPTIGVAFLVMMPVLYTDTSGAARLVDRRKRLMIDFAGIFAELAAAVVFTVLWIFLPDGPLRSFAFATATVSWVMSLIINLNPFMRFDGYYILSDFLGVENLQQRGFELAKWRLRELLFLPRQEPPEQFESGLRRFLILHAVGTWVYRFFLFIGIAFLVYEFFFKALGMFLFAVEMIWFIGMPIAREASHWWSVRQLYSRTDRSKFTMVAFLLTLLLLFVPWSTRVHVPAVLSAGAEYRVFAPESAWLEALDLEPGKRVQKGELLMVLRSPDIDTELKTSGTKLQLLELQKNRRILDPLERSVLKVTYQELNAENARHDALVNRQKRLKVSAPISGMIVDLDPELHQGQWVSGKQPLAIIRSTEQTRIIGLVEGADRDRVLSDTEGTFIPENSQLQKLRVRLSKVSDIAIRTINEPALADVHGGPVETIPDENKNSRHLAPRGTWYEAEMLVDEQTANFELKQILRGSVILEGEAESIALRVFSQVASVLIRESGF